MTNGSLIDYLVINASDPSRIAFSHSPSRRFLLHRPLLQQPLVYSPLSPAPSFSEHFSRHFFSVLFFPITLFFTFVPDNRRFITIPSTTSFHIKLFSRTIFLTYSRSGIIVEGWFEEDQVYTDGLLFDRNNSREHWRGVSGYEIFAEGFRRKSSIRIMSERYSMEVLRWWFINRRSSMGGNPYVAIDGEHG